MGMIFNIQHFSLHDGPGIRSTVFFKGCPMRCIWCHNPESQKRERQISYSEQLCIGCGKCQVCPKGVFYDRNQIRWSDCILCERCVKACPTRAVEMVGREASVDEIIREVLMDKAFYEFSGGGVTLSGGEPMQQAEFALDILQRCKAERVHTVLETCGQCGFEKLEKVLPYLDLILYDIKLVDEQKHKTATGCGNARILENLKRLVEEKRAVCVRTPLIPGYTDTEENLHAVGMFLRKIGYQGRMELLPYNELAGTKYQSLGMEFKLKNDAVQPTERMEKMADILQGYGVDAKIRR